MRNLVVSNLPRRSLRGIQCCSGSHAGPPGSEFLEITKVLTSGTKLVGAVNMPLEIIELQTKIYQIKKDCHKDVDDLLYNKRRRDNIRTMNNGGTPRESTLLKYNIEYDDQTKLYK